jgi:hypothetical protein
MPIAFVILFKNLLGKEISLRLLSVFERHISAHISLSVPHASVLRYRLCNMNTWVCRDSVVRVEAFACLF